MYKMEILTYKGKDYLTIKESARVLDVPKHYIYHQIKKGNLVTTNYDSFKLVELNPLMVLNYFINNKKEELKNGK